MLKMVKYIACAVYHIVRVNKYIKLSVTEHVARMEMMNTLKFSTCKRFGN